MFLNVYVVCISVKYILRSETAGSEGRHIINFCRSHNFLKRLDRFTFPNSCLIPLPCLVECAGISLLSGNSISDLPVTNYVEHLFKTYLSCFNSQYILNPTNHCHYFMSLIDFAV